MPMEKTKARFFEPMLLLATGSLPEGDDWEYELKLEAIVAIAFKSNGKVHLHSRNTIFYYAFDLLILNGRDVRFQPLETRRELLRTKVLSKLREPVRYSPDLDASLPDLVRSVRE
jgi:ATP-dependent DNA ligase